MNRLSNNLNSWHALNNVSKIGIYLDLQINIIIENSESLSPNKIHCFFAVLYTAAEM